MITKKNMWILIILLLILISYYFIINVVIWNLKNSFDFDNSKFNEAIYDGTMESKIKIKHQFPLVSFNSCKLMIYGSNTSGEEKLLYSGEFKKELNLTGIDDDYILSFHVIKGGKLYIYGSKGSGIKANSKQAIVTLFLQHSDKYHGHYKIEY